MFTGLISEIGTVTRLRRVPAGLSWAIAAEQTAAQLRVGDSVNISGACQTVESIRAGEFTGTAIPETLSVTNFAQWRVGRRVNLEPALRADGRLGGHLVSGHVDCVGRVGAVRRDVHGSHLGIAIHPRFDPWIVPKGSVALDGVSLTIASVYPGSFTVALIPETLTHTTFGSLHVGDAVNVEFDQLVKAAVSRRNRSQIDAAMLARAGW
ncbi:MAG: riboflavin synthase [Candidatus Zixiibacteriota bacterium]